MRVGNNLAKIVPVGVMALVGCGLLAPAVALAGPVAEDPDTVIGELRADGYRVVITKVGTAQISQCTVTSVSEHSPVTSQGRSPGNSSQQGSWPEPDYKVAHVTLGC